MWNPNVLNWPSWIHSELGDGLEKIINKRHAQGQLPNEFMKYVGIDKKKFPTIRSIVEARPGWCMVESDYQTAEMRGLAVISGDLELIRLIEEPDTRFAKPHPDHIPEGVDAEDCVIRLSFPPEITNPPDKEKFIMTYTVNGNIIKKFTEDQLLRDKHGNIVSPKFDMHWSTVEIARRTCREVLDKKKDRGAGKVGNFCLTGDAKILVSYRKEGKYVTDKVPLKDVDHNMHVWDGMRFAPHSGVICNGVRPTIRWCGINATPDHPVFTHQGIMCLLDAVAAKAIIRRTNETLLVGDYDEPLYDLPARRSEIRDLANWVVASKYHHDDTGPAVQEWRDKYGDTHTDKRLKILKEMVLRETYDLIDCGWRHRFTANGRLVMNSSSYGASPTSIERKIEADIGSKPPPGTGAAILDAIESRQKVATRFLKHMETIPETTGYLRAASGRIRHCHALAKGIKGLKARTREGQITALGRECRNFPQRRGK